MLRRKLGAALFGGREFLSFSSRREGRFYFHVNRSSSSGSVSGPEPNYSARSGAGCLLFEHTEEVQFEYGGTLRSMRLAYETWGRLNSSKSNAILLTCGLSASSHAKSHAGNKDNGWWERFIGPGMAIDTNRFFVVCVNNIGGCNGSSGPSSISDEDPRRRYALRFPVITVNDLVRANFLLLDHLGISRLHAVVGASLGGMQSLAAAAEFPDRIDRVVSISATALSYPLSIALRFAQRQALMADENFNGGDYYDGPHPTKGMMLARGIGTITYRSGEEWKNRFGRQRLEPGQTPKFELPDFTVEDYLRHQGENWTRQYDPNSMVVLSKCMDLFTLEKQNADGKMCLLTGTANIQMPTLVMGVKSDLLFPISQQREVANLLRKNGNSRVTFYELDSLYGHDTFLIDVVNVGAAVKGHLDDSCETNTRCKFLMSYLFVSPKMKLNL